MYELMNFSGYPVDFSRFDNNWEEVRRYVSEEGFDGIELLLGGEHTHSAPPDLVHSVHLPGWLGWNRVIREPESIPPDIDQAEENYFFGARDQESLTRSFQSLLREADSLSAKYAVFHISHIELPDIYTGDHRYTSEQVLSASAEFLNRVCSEYKNGEPPVTIGCENLWWNGLTFSRPEETEYFMDSLEFDNWAFVLDTGHLMNRLSVTDESAGIREVVHLAESLPDSIVERIKSVHLQCSTSGFFQKDFHSEKAPAGFESMSYMEKISHLIPYISQIDEHRAFSDPASREIISTLEPDYLVHEFVTRSREEHQTKIRQQRKVLGYA